MKYEASLQCFLRKLKHKNFFNENKYDKLYPSGSAATRIYGTLKMHKFSSVDSFTNIPLQETIDIARNLIFNPNPNLSITKKELKKLFLFSTSQTQFIFNSKVYNQIDGVAMGSPLASVLANIFMGFYESKWLNEYITNKPKFYLRYVDDILAAFEKEQDSRNVLNKRDPNIKFTIKLTIPLFF